MAEARQVDIRRLGEAVRALLLGAAAAYAVDIPKPATAEACSDCHADVGTSWCVNRGSSSFAHQNCWISGGETRNWCRATGLCK